MTLYIESASVHSEVAHFHFLGKSWCIYNNALMTTGNHYWSSTGVWETSTPCAGLFVETTMSLLQTELEKNY